MSYISSTYQQQLYKEYQQFGRTEYRAIVRFFEDHQVNISQLHFSAYFEILVSYIEALFEMGAYEKYLTIVDHAVEISITQNIKIHKGFNVFQRLLFRKAASHYHLGNLEKAIYILKELIRICPSEDLYNRFLIRCIRKETPTYVSSTRAISIALFFLSAAIIIVELIYVRSFHDAYTSTVEWTRNSIFILGWFVLLSGDTWHYLTSHRFVKKYVKEVKEKKIERHKERRNQFLG